MSAANHVTGREITRHNPIARAWRALVAAWDEPEAGSPIAASRRAALRNQSFHPPSGGDGMPPLIDLPPNPMYAGSDGAESSLLRMLEESAAYALDLEDLEPLPEESAHPSPPSWRERRAS